MRTKEAVTITKSVVRKVAPHVPAIVVFAAVEYVLSRFVYRRSLASLIAVPIILALVTEFFTQVVEGIVTEKQEMPTAAVLPMD
jgi:hypothetical protein